MQHSEFYPMITHTLRSLLGTVEPREMWDYMCLILAYPETDDSLVNMGEDPVALAKIAELDLQYEPWKKGGHYAKQENA